MTLNEYHDVRMATLYELQIRFRRAEKKEFSLDEVCDLIDNFALDTQEEVQLRKEAHQKEEIQY